MPLCVARFWDRFPAPLEDDLSPAGKWGFQSTGAPGKCSAPGAKREPPRTPRGTGSVMLPWAAARVTRDAATTTAAAAAAAAVATTDAALPRGAAPLRHRRTGGGRRDREAGWKGWAGAPEGASTDVAAVAGGIPLAIVLPRQREWAFMARGLAEGG